MTGLSLKMGSQETGIRAEERSVSDEKLLCGGDITRAAFIEPLVRGLDNVWSSES
jgi:hypothetical protein